MSALALLLACASIAAFGLATDAHHQRVTGRRLTPPVRRSGRAAAWLMLALSAVAAIAARGWAFGLVWWCGVVMLAAGAVFLLLNLTRPASTR